jgi:acetylornithine deacetylase/succinyl-diaminopimelate desuccinylase-like protein
MSDFFTTNRSRIRDELFEFLRIPSVSARSEHNRDTERAAEWIAGAMTKIGLKTRIHPTAVQSIVVGEWRGAPGAPTLLIYGH